MDNKIFFLVFNNKVLCNLIFSKVKHIHRDIRRNREDSLFKWDQLLGSLHSLACYNYLNEVNQYHMNRLKNNQQILINNSSHYIPDKLMDYIARGDSLEVLQYFMVQQPELLIIKTVYALSVRYNSMRIFNYLESLTSNNNDNDSNKKIKTSIASSPSSSLPITTNNLKLDYYQAISEVPVSGNMVLFYHFINKVDIRGTLLDKIIKYRYVYHHNNNEHKYTIQFIYAAAEYNRSEMLDHISGLFKSDMYSLDEILIDQLPSITEIIIMKGRFNIFKQCFNHNNISIRNQLNCNSLLLKCAKHNQFKMMKYFHDNQIGGDSFGAIDKAAHIGNLEMIKWLHENRSEGCTTNAMDEAAQCGHFEIVKWLHHNRSEGCTTDAMDNAAWNGHLEIIKWLHENRSEGCTIIAMDKAAKNEHFETIKWLHHNRTEGCTIDAMDYAAEKGNLETIKWLHENRTEGCTTKAMDYATWNGHFEIIKWLHHNRTEGCTSNAIDNAASRGHLEITKWFHHNRTEGCTAKAIFYAKQNNHLEIVKFFDSI